MKYHFIIVKKKKYSKTISAKKKFINVENVMVQKNCEENPSKEILFIISVKKYELLRKYANNKAKDDKQKF